MGKEADFFLSRVTKARRFCLDLEPSAEAALTVVSGGVEDCSPDYDNRRDGFPFHCVEFVAGGFGTLELAGRRHCLVPGSVFSYGPGVPHHIACSPEAPMTKYFVDAAGARAPELLAVASLPPGTAARTKCPADVAAAFEQLVKHGCKEGRRGKEICAALFEALAFILADNVTPQGAAVERALPTFQRVKGIVDAKFLALGSLEEVARVCGLDPAYLCRLFKRFEGETPYRYLTKLKMRHAADLLQGGGALVKEAALAANFDDPYQFSKTFKRVYGVSPEKFAKLASRRP